MTDTIEEYPLNSKWILWCHSLTNNNWDLDSYNKIYELNNLYDYKTYIDSISLNDYHNSMFFLMNVLQDIPKQVFYFFLNSLIFLKLNFLLVHHHF